LSIPAASSPEDAHQQHLVTLVEGIARDEPAREPRGFVHVAERQARQCCFAQHRVAVGPQLATADKKFCAYRAASEELVREHARRGGFPADQVLRVQAVVDPPTAEA
jgi:hypothetical protein